jgi:hypothetical protein
VSTRERLESVLAAVEQRVQRHASCVAGCIDTTRVVHAGPCAVAVTLGMRPPPSAPTALVHPELRVASCHWGFPETRTAASASVLRKRLCISCTSGCAAASAWR